MATCKPRLQVPTLRKFRIVGVVKYCFTTALALALLALAGCSSVGYQWEPQPTQGGHYWYQEPDKSYPTLAGVMTGHLGTVHTIDIFGNYPASGRWGYERLPALYQRGGRWYGPLYVPGGGWD